MPRIPGLGRQRLERLDLTPRGWLHLGDSKVDGSSLVLSSEILLARTNQETNQSRHAKETSLQKLTESEGRLGAHEETQE